MRHQFYKFKRMDPGQYPCKNKSLSNLPGEKWKSVPAYEDAYTVSNFGRIKSLARNIYYKNGRIIHKKDAIISSGLVKAPNYYVKDFVYQVNITLHLEGKKQTVSVRRLVYHCFVEPIDLQDYSFVISCKDGNSLNLYYKNLNKISLTQKQKRIYKRNRAVSSFSFLDMKKLAQKGALKRMRQITQYDLQGRKIKVYPGIKAAAEATGCSRPGISDVLKGLMLKTSNYIWRYGDGTSKIDLDGYWDKGRLRASAQRCKRVTQYNRMGERIATYSSITEASKTTGILSSYISRCILGELNIIKGFVWRLGKGRKKISTKGLMSRDEFIASRQKKVAQYTSDGKLVTLHDSIRKAARAIGIHASSISASARGVHPMGGGYRWKFVTRKTQMKEYRNIQK